VPAEIGSLKQLASLWLFENHFTGPLPECFDGLHKLADVRVNSNRLSGPVPLSLGGCSSLSVLNLQKNSLTGPVPEEVLTKCIKLKDLRLWANRLTGPLSPEVSCLRHLEVLLLQRNLLNWVLPPQLGKCKALRKLDLSHNAFRGELPPHTFGTLVDLDHLSVANNPRLSGAIPRELRQLRCLMLVDLSGTSLEDLDEFAADMASGKSAAPPNVKVIVEGYSKDPLSDAP
jgi:Leucine-rich repeat (LRR) protein